LEALAFEEEFQYFDVLPSANNGRSRENIKNGNSFLCIIKVIQLKKEQK